MYGEELEAVLEKLRVAKSLDKLGQFLQNKLSRISVPALIHISQTLASSQDLDLFPLTSLYVKLMF